MKIALIQCPVWGTYDPPVALAQLSSCLKKDGQEVFVLDMNIKLYLKRTENYKNMWAWEQSQFWYNADSVKDFFKNNKGEIDKHVENIVNSKAKIIGFSVNAASRLSSILLAKHLKALDKGLIIVFGGPLFFEEKFIDSVLSEDSVDIVVYGEGEISFCELVKLIEAQRDISSCQGIAFKKDDCLVNTGDRKSLIDLNTLPFLDFVDLPLSDYDDSQHIPLMSSRGCVQRCVFCSSRIFWPGYRSMSGERIFREIEYHKRREGKLNPNLGHVDFLDLLFNGDMRALINFCDLMKEAKLDIYWTANMIIRSEMTLDVIRKMKEAGCEHVIFGIESGSQHVLNLMKKNYRIEDADRIIRYMHEVGIVVTCNFMFGFPGETEEDFQCTLDFIRRNANFLTRAYPSRTYCAIEEYSYFHSHLKEFGIVPNPPNHLYWESTDGQNIYPVRLQRCEEFCKVASSIGIEVGCGVQTSVELDKWYNLGFYYEFKKDYNNAMKSFLAYNSFDPTNEVIANKVDFYYKEFKKHNLNIVFDENLFMKLEEAIRNKKGERKEMLNRTIEKLGRGQSLSLSKQKQKENSELNDREYESQKVFLNSSPKAFFMQVAGPCNSHCTFCSRGANYSLFDLESHRSLFEEKLNKYLLRSEQIILTGSGEFLQLPNNEEILTYFNFNFPQAEKMFSTNGSSLTPMICEKIVNSKNKYTIHISLHASNSDIHRTMTRMDSFHKILGQLNYLLKLRRDERKVSVNLIFVATTLNIEDLSNFVRMAADLGVDRVICYYNYIYVPAQKYLSCFFKQKATNKMLDEAEKLGRDLNIKIDLPPRFGLESYPERGICREPWSQFMLNAEAQVIPCDASEDANENLSNKRFEDVWNGLYYQNLRKTLIDKTASCFRHCFRANPASVNDFSSHVIHRGKKEKIDVLWGDNF